MTDLSLSPQPVGSPVRRVQPYPCLLHPARGRVEHGVGRHPGSPDAHLPGVDAGTRPALRPGMPKRARREVDRSATTDVVSQLECAIRRPQATLIGALVGGLVPWFARTLAHEEVPAAWTAGDHALAVVMIAVVLGCACFSGLSVHKFGRATFGDARKAIGFTIALEGVMLVSRGATSAVALVALVAINALGNGSAIALARDAACRRREADARRAATRARSRSSRVPARGDAPAPAAPASPPRRPVGTPGLVRVPIWTAPADDAIDAEIVSEELLS